MPKLIDLTGQRFGRLTVLSQAVSVSGNARWNCKCDCGTEKTILAQDLKRGRTVSCGCHKAEMSSKVHRTHGMSRHPAYNSWKMARRRCDNPDDVGYSLYGGRGITFCDRWRDFDLFWLDMSKGWRPGLSIDRIDNNKGYEPGNCQWSTPTRQSRNRRSNRIIQTPSGPMTVTDAAETFGVSRRTIFSRLNYGWTDPHELVKPAGDKRAFLKQNN